MSSARSKSRNTRNTRTTTSDTAASSLAADFLADVDEAVREQMAASQTAREFLQDAGTLSLADRRLLVEQALILLEQNYVHLQLKSAMHAVAPLQRLRLLRLRLERQTSATMDPEPQFHAEMSEIFHSMRDLHTNYLLPEPFKGKVAYLPFLIEQYYDADGERHYVVSHIVDGFTGPGFARGVELTHWCGIPIDRAVDEHAARFAGSNSAARHARGLESLTIRPLVIHLPPLEEWVTVTYLTEDGLTQSLRQEWLVVDNLPSFIGDPDEVSAAATALGLDLDSDEAGRAKTMLFAPAVVGAVQDTDDPATRGARPTDAADAPDAPAAAGEQLTTTMPGVFRARSVQTSSGVYGHIRIFTFAVDDPEAFVAEFVRLIRQLPPEGLIIDVRDNGGGHIHASEFTLQTLTPRRITPEPVQFSATPLNRQICRRHRTNPTRQIDLGPWFDSLERFTETGAGYSGAFPITPTDGANAMGQQYHGPVVLITDARCYSATDIFAAGFADHQIGTILGVDDNTGAGGANVWTHGLLTALLRLPAPDPTSPFVPLPNGANMRVSVRRTLRVGEATAGTPVEDLGVTPDVRHHMTRADVLDGNVDLLDHAGEILSGQQARKLDVTADRGADGTLGLEIETIGVDRVDVYVDDRPRDSVDVPGTGDATTATEQPVATAITIDRAATATRVRVDGLHEGARIASRTVPLSGRNGSNGRAPMLGLGRMAGAATTAQPRIVYVHGAGNKPPADDLKHRWDIDLFHRDLGDQSSMAHYADILHRRPGVIGADACDEGSALASLIGADADRAEGVDGVTTDDLAEDLTQLAATAQGRRFAASLAGAVTDHAAESELLRDANSGVLPLPAAIRRILLRRLLRRLVPDAEAYFFTSKAKRMRARVRSALRSVDGTAIVVTHSLGTVIAYDVLRDPAFASRDIRLWVTLGSPLGYREIQDEVTRPLRVPAPVQRWTNVADRLDVVALDTGLANDFNGGLALVDLVVDNPSPNNHAACGYLRAAAVRDTVNAGLVATPVV